MGRIADLRQRYRILNYFLLKWMKDSKTKTNKQNNKEKEGGKKLEGEKERNELPVFASAVLQWLMWTSPCHSGVMPEHYWRQALTYKNIIRIWAAPAALGAEWLRIQKSGTDHRGSSGISYSSSRDCTVTGVIEVKTSIRPLLVTLHTGYEVPLLVASESYCSLELTTRF